MEAAARSTNPIATADVFVHSAAVVGLTLVANCGGLDEWRDGLDPDALQSVVSTADQAFHVVHGAAGEWQGEGGRW